MLVHCLLSLSDEKVFCFQNDLRISRVDNVHFLRHLGMKEHNVTLLASTKVKIFLKTFFCEHFPEHFLRHLRNERVDGHAGLTQ